MPTTKLSPTQTECVRKASPARAYVNGKEVKGARGVFHTMNTLRCLNLAGFCTVPQRLTNGNGWAYLSRTGLALYNTLNTTTE